MWPDFVESGYQEVRNVRFSENLARFVSWSTRFEIRPFALLPTIFGSKISKKRDIARKVFKYGFFSFPYFPVFTPHLTYYPNYAFNNQFAEHDSPICS